MISQESYTETVLPSVFLNDSQDLDKFYNWAFEMIHPYLKGRVLQAEAGDGAFTAIFVQHDISLYAADTRKTNRDLLRSKFHDIDSVKSVYAIDLNKPDFKNYYFDVLGVFDTIIAINTDEKGIYSKGAIFNANLLLRENGNLILTAPVFTTLYNGIRESIYDLKKYNIFDLQKLLPNHLSITKLRYYNLIVDITPTSDNHLGLSALMVANKTNMKV